MAQGSDNILKWIAIAAIGAVVLFVGWFVYNESTKSGPEPKADVGIPKTAKKIADIGRTHVKEGEIVKYNSNPPTSGPHYAEWEKAGSYDEPQQDEFLVHSLEHGYIIMSYNCESKKQGFISKAYAQDASPTQATGSANCEEVKKQLKDVLNEKGNWKLILVPRPSLDVPIALTAWTYVDKMDKFEKSRIVSFIDALRDKGPEKTME